MKILITGGAGFIGSHLAEAELNLGNEIVALDLQNNEKVKHLLDDPKFKFIQGDILNKELIEDLVKNSDLVYHLAAIANVHTYVKDPLKVLNVGIDGTRNILEFAHKYNKKILFTSTSEIYGKNSKIPWKEDDDRVLGSTTKHRWCYSSSKAVGEHYAFGYKEKGLNVIIVRLFNIYGPKMDFLGGGRVLTVFLEQFLNNKPVTVAGTGNQTRCFTYITDCISALTKLMRCEKAEGHVFNIGTNFETPIIELAYIMKEIGNFSSPIIKISHDEKWGKGYEDIERRVPDISKIKEFIDYEPKITLGEGLRKSIEYFKRIHNAQKG